MLDPSSTESAGVSRIVKFKCDMCKIGYAKYRCPGCSLRTCCLPCVNLHKQEFNCTGVRNKTKFVSLAQFDDMTLLSDYRFLEETARAVDNSQRYHMPRGNPNSFSYWKHKLVKACYHRNIRLMVMPSGFQRRTNNTTFLKGKNIFWCVEWIFYGNMKFKDARVPEETSLQTAVQRYFDPESSELEISSKLTSYCEAGIQGSVPLLKKEGMSKPKYVRLDWTKSLTENLRGNTVIEFPTIHIALLNRISQYDIIEETTN